MKKKILQLTALLMSSIVVISGFSACAKKPQTTSELPSETSEVIDEGNKEEVVSSSGVVKLKDLKKKYGVIDENQIKPFYNVDQQTEFVFHFKNKDIEPCYAITVHTDPKCELNSTVYQLNDGYITDEGLDVVVKPGKPVLNETTQYDNYNWGNAPIYYLAIRYDMNSEEMVALDEPIIVPFTIYNEVSTPNAEASIKPNGAFEISWKPVAGAKEYKIYEAQKVKSWGAENYTRAECGYVGDHLELLTTVDASTTSFSDFKLDGSDNTLESGGYVIQQNSYPLGTYYIAAVDASGNESQLSMAISGWRYENQLPFNFDKSAALYGLGTSMNPLTTFPASVDVIMMDKTTSRLPINFKKISEPKDSYENAVYEYSIVGTKLTGTVYYSSADGTYPDEVNSTFETKADMYEIKNDINIIPENTVGTIPSSTKDIDLSKKAVYPEEQKLQISQDARLLRADIEGARIIADGIYVGDTPFTIGSYIEGGKNQTYEIPEHVEKEQNGLPVETPEASPSEETTAEETSEVISEEPSEEVSETVSEEVSEEVSEKPSEEQSEEPSEEPSVPAEETDEITSKELVDEQMETTKEEVAEANEETFEASAYPIFADSAEEEYLATCMVNAMTDIDITAFPSLQNTEYLADVLTKVVRQNPYIVSASGFGYNSQHVVVEYELSESDIKTRQEAAYKECKNIISSVITPSMTDEEKILAIWKYLENNTSYDFAACDAAVASNFQNVSGYEDSFNIYGIMCKKVGVCQSYSYVYKALLSEAGIPCISLVGCCQKTMPHAWNAVKLDGTWYWIDATNNSNTSGIPYFLYQTSSDFAVKNEYVLDDEFDLNNNLGYVIHSDTSKDFYTKNNLIANSSSELSTAIANAYKVGPSKYKGKNVIAIRYSGPAVTSTDLQNIVSALVSAGMSENDISSAQLGQSSQYIFVLY